MQSITVDELLQNVERLNVSIYSGKEYLTNPIVSSRVQRPGLALAGYFEHIRGSRVELFGETEMCFLAQLDEKRRRDVLFELAKLSKSVFVVSKNLDVPQELAEAAAAHNIPVVCTSETTVQTDNELSNYLDFVLAPETVIHGVCMEVCGLGIIIVGGSGIGKSECALELVKRGHRFVADDAVTLKRRHHYLVGAASGVLQNYIELRGVGVIDVPLFFGMPSVLTRKKIGLIIHFMNFQEWNEQGSADRLALDKKVRHILGVDVPELICPVSPGRNMAEIVELAATHHRLCLMGHDSTRTFTEKVIAQMQNK
jgi:HPr kinase/phosphorylase